MDYFDGIVTLMELWIDLDGFSKELQEDVQGLTLMELWIDLDGFSKELEEDVQGTIAT